MKRVKVFDRACRRCRNLSKHRPIARGMQDACQPKNPPCPASAKPDDGDRNPGFLLLMSCCRRWHGRHFVYCIHFDA